MSDIMNCEGCGRAFGYSMLREGRCKRCWSEGINLMPEPPVGAYGDAGKRASSSYQSEVAATSYLNKVNTVFAVAGALISLIFISAGAVGVFPLGISILWGLLCALGTAIVWAVIRVFIALAQDMSAIRKKLEDSDS